MTEFKEVISEKDIAEVADLAKDIWQKHYLSIIGQKQVDYMLKLFQSRAAIAKQLAQNYLYFKVMCGDKLAGYISVLADNGKEKLLLSKIYIRTEFRRQGLGKEALNFIEDLCHHGHISKIWLTVNKNNTGSIDWYTHMGFKNIEAIVQDIGDGFIMDDFIMEKTVYQACDGTEKGL